MDEILDAIANSPVGVFMAENTMAFPVVETMHVIAIVTVIGVIAIVDLRLLGVAGRDYAISRLTKALLPTTWIAFALAALTGALLFTSQPVTYFANTAFRLKVALLFAAGLNMALFHVFTMRGIAFWDRDAPVPPSARIAGALSLLIWVLIAGCGRWVGFTTAPF